MIKTNRLTHFIGTDFFRSCFTVIVFCIFVSIFSGCETRKEESEPEKLQVVAQESGAPVSYEPDFKTDETDSDSEEDLLTQKMLEFADAWVDARMKDDYSKIKLSDTYFFEGKPCDIDSYKDIECYTYKIDGWENHYVLLFTYEFMSKYYACWLPSYDFLTIEEKNDGSLEGLFNFAFPHDIYDNYSEIFKRDDVIKLVEEIKKKVLERLPNVNLDYNPLFLLPDTLQKEQEHWINEEKYKFYDTYPYYYDEHWVWKADLEEADKSISQMYGTYYNSDNEKIVFDESTFDGRHYYVEGCVCPNEDGSSEIIISFEDNPEEKWVLSEDVQFFKEYSSGVKYLYLTGLMPDNYYLPKRFSSIEWNNDRELRNNYPDEVYCKHVRYAFELSIALDPDSINYYNEDEDDSFYYYGDIVGDNEDDYDGNYYGNYYDDYSSSQSSKDQEYYALALSYLPYALMNNKTSIDIKNYSIVGLAARHDYGMTQDVVIEIKINYNIVSVYAHVKIDTWSGDFNSGYVSSLVDF